MQTQQTDDQITGEILAILNCLTIDFTKALECLLIFKEQLIELFSYTISQRKSQKINIIAMRFLRSLLANKILTASDFEESLENLFMTMALCLDSTITNISLISEIVALFCRNPKTRQLTRLPEYSLLSLIGKFIAKDNVHASEECLINCLEALAWASYEE